jgi:hypothetical protein
VLALARRPLAGVAGMAGTLFSLQRWRDERFRRALEIDARLFGELHAELVAQNARAHLLDLALRQIAQLERAERDAD